jgi:hypothetical protein
MDLRCMLHRAEGAMDRFVTLFATMLAFVYHCFDRIVIHGYLSSLSRPSQCDRSRSRLSPLLAELA